MRDEDKTKEQLINELAEMRQWITELEALEPERERAEEEIRQRTAQLEVLRQVGLEITAQLDLDTLLGSIVSRATELLGGTSGGLYLYRPEQDVLEWAVAIGPHLVPTGTVLHRGEGLSGRVWETGEPLIVDDYQHWEGRPAFYEGYPWTAVVGVPVCWGKEFLGVLDVLADPPRTFSPADADLLSLFAAQATIAIRNARLYEQAQQEIAERKRAEEALRASQEYARNIIDSSLNMIISVDMDRHIVEFNRAAQETFGYRPQEVLGKHVDILYADPQEALTVHQTTVEKGQCVREVLDRRKNGQVFPAFISASVLRDARGGLVGVMGVARDITERKRAEEALRRRNRELALLNRAGQAFGSTLDLDQVLFTVLEEVRRLLDVVACSVWLIESGTDELVCRQAVGPQSEIVRGWRLALGEGLAGWVARSGESLIVPDVRADERHFKGVDQQTGLGLRSILSVPLWFKEDVIGVLQVVDTEVGRFSPTDLTLLESLAASAAIAIENARLYERARQDAETRSVLLREVNHRVQNNLTAIIGFLYAARRRAGMEDQAVYQSIMQDLVNRVQGLSTVHSLLSASGWAPLRLSELSSQVIRSSLQMLPRDKRVFVEVSPSPVRVTPDQAHDLALVINELTTNTVKHTLGERNTGHLTVRIALEDATVLFEFRDDGPGYPQEVLQLKCHDVGLDLIQNIVRKGLRGELSLHNDHGAVAVIQFKAKA